MQPEEQYIPHTNKRQVCILYNSNIFILQNQKTIQHKIKCTTTQTSLVKCLTS